MTAKMLGRAWDCDLPPDEKLVLLAYADNAADNGVINIPLGRIAWKTG
jgi:hypothetical protein